MQYLMLVCQEPAHSSTAPSDADIAGAPDVEQWWQQANDDGRYVIGSPLRPAPEAVTVRVRGGARLVTEGPFTEAGEFIGGFDVLDCADLDEAIEVAVGHPMAHRGVIELRAFWPFEDQ
ncbi:MULTISPECIES: YciI family protein [Aestuariimicrobium]|uniref:YciI family protein n=1 Tax=Aestuariimicrobium TaxID=396388 RepID=UPI0003B7AA53|nr:MULTISPECIES: YciI family protein [Aestuariimicrobium]CAI9404070.1 hypothetical protein AESSP_01133 [Aestuariimicrobium sp. T2.26MG-19.2B]